MDRRPGVIVNQLPDVEQAIKDLFARDPVIGSPRISISFFDDTVALQGEVGSLREKERAQFLLKQVIPDCPIDNSLVVTANRVEDDDALTREAQEALAAAPGIPKELGVSVVNGIARLVGDTPSLETRRKAHEIVAAIPGIRRVRDEEATVMGQMSYEGAGAPDLRVGIDDITITNRIEDLLAEKMAPPRADEVEVRVSNGTVTLTGYVKGADERAQAEHLAMSVSGVKSVKNHLVSLDGSYGCDETIRSRIEHAFGEARHVSGVNVKAWVVEDTVYLTGDVDTPEQRDEAERIAKGTPGVAHVRNDITIVTRRERPVRGPGTPGRTTQ